MRQKIQASILLMILILFLCPYGVQAAGENGASEGNLQDSFVEGQVDDLGLEELKGFWEDIVSKYGGYLPESQKGSLVDFIKGDKQFSIKQWLYGVSKFAFQELIMNGKLLGSLIMLTIFSMFLQSLQNAFDQGNVSKVAYAIVFMVLIIIALNSFHVAIEYTQDAINTMVHFIIALFPLLLALIATSGGVASAAFFHPVIILLMNTSGLLIEYVVLPLLFLSALLSIVSTLSDQHKVTQLAQLLRNWSIGLLGIFMTVFLGVISVQGAASAVTDGITIRTAKFVTGNFIPVIGRMFTDATDTVISASVLLKNTVGIAGVAILLLIAAFPAIKILVIAFIYKLAAALLQPIGGGPVIACLDTISKSVIYVFAALAIVSFMFFLSLTVMIAAGNITLMIR
ncbi:stage III sporulation protein AE [Falsibacillus pallidus]|uniref:Stage III sporulation protein AE n=1 Tax=Falsibacillus pallidus TaxID=493781 RepID=A0A370GBN5_9BACI|nr:stage III sporulation protein AE [Falsibacillus pallidus]RDI41188.1 stage III sporulation protein AE [Falsibacillus pallidus]